MGDFQDKCNAEVEQFGAMCPALPGTRAVFVRRVDDKVVEEWSIPVVAWAVSNRYGADRWEEHPFVNSSVEPIVVVGTCAVTARDAECDFADGTSFHGIIMPNGEIS